MLCESSVNVELVLPWARSILGMSLFTFLLTVKGDF